MEITKSDAKKICNWLSLLMIDIGEYDKQYEPMSKVIERLLQQLNKKETIKERQENGEFDEPYPES